MGSVAFLGEDESQPSTSKLSTTLIDGCDAVNRALIPKKLRSAIKKRGRESITLPLLISRKQHHVSITVDTLKKDGAKKSKLNMKQGHITKDEKEVAETLYALAGMFSDANKADQRGLDDEKPEIKSSVKLEERSLINAAQDNSPILREVSGQMSSKGNLKSVFLSSNLVKSTAEGVKSQMFEAPQPEFFPSEKAVNPNASGDLSEISPGSTSRPVVSSTLGSNQSCEQEIHMDQFTASGVQYGNNSIDMFQSPNLSATTHKSCPRIPSLFERTNLSSHPRVSGSKITTEKLVNKSNEPWKRCSAHVYISRLINILQISERKEGLSVQPTQSTAGKGAGLQPHVSIHNQMPRINDRNGNAYFSAIDLFSAKKDSSEIQNDTLLHKRPVENQQMASETSAKQGYDFLSLGSGLCGSDTNKSANRAGCFHEPLIQFHLPYMQSQSHSSPGCSLPQNCYSSPFNGHNSSLAAQQLAQYNSSMTTGRRGQQMEQQKWAAQLQTGGGGVQRFPGWKNGGIDSASVLNYAHSLFPHLHAALLSPSQQQAMAISSSLPLSNMKRHHHNLLERNGAVYHTENMAQLQLQLPCNQQL